MALNIVGSLHVPADLRDAEVVGDEIAKLRDKYETKARSLRDKIEASEDR